MIAPIDAGIEMIMTLLSTRGAHSIEVVCLGSAELIRGCYKKSKGPDLSNVGLTITGKPPRH